MAGASTDLSDKLLNHVFRDTSYTQPATVYIALNSVMPADDGTGGTELSGTGYARVGVATTDAAWSAPAAGTGNKRKIDNAAAVDFGTAGSDWAPSGAPCVGFTQWTASSGGTYMGGAAFSASKIIQLGDPVKFNANTLVISID